ncbi:MAG: hypothetical protein PHC83_06680 [Bacteroidales bacterium]|nr:hypothetical protein [Bacteroidales bacterium]
MNKRENMTQKEEYIAPDIQVIEVNVEKGFAQSGSGDRTDPGGEDVEGGF